MFEVRDDLKDYFETYDEDLFVTDDNGKRVHYRSVYSGFKGEKIFTKTKGKKQNKKETWLEFKEQGSILDDLCNRIKCNIDFLKSEHLFIINLSVHRNSNKLFGNLIHLSC